MPSTTDECDPSLRRHRLHLVPILVPTLQLARTGSEPELLQHDARRTRRRPAAPRSRAIARFGSFNPCPVTVHTIVSPRSTKPSAARLEQPGHRRGRGGLDEHALLRGQHPVRLEDLGVGDRPDVAAATRRGRRSPRPSWPDCRSGSRWRSSPGAATGSPSTSGAEPAACQPSIRGRFVTRPSRAYSP